MRSLILTLITITAMGCAHDTGPTLPDRPRANFSGNEGIYVTDSIPEFAHTAIALIGTGVHRAERVQTEGIAELRHEAERLGADAVINVQAHPQLVGEEGPMPNARLGRGTHWVTVYRLSGTAVRMEKGAPPLPTEPPIINLPN